jgi:hypothetical protein
MVIRHRASCPLPHFSEPCWALPSGTCSPIELSVGTPEIYFWRPFAPCFASTDDGQPVYLLTVPVSQSGCGRPTRRSRSYRGSERNMSKRGSTLPHIAREQRSRTASSKWANAATYSPRAARVTATDGDTYFSTWPWSSSLTLRVHHRVVLQRRTCHSSLLEPKYFRPMLSTPFPSSQWLDRIVLRVRTPVQQASVQERNRGECRGGAQSPPVRARVARQFAILRTRRFLLYNPTAQK